MRDIALTLKDKMTILLYIQIWQKWLSVAKLKTPSVASRQKYHKA